MKKPIPTAKPIPKFKKALARTTCGLVCTKPSLQPEKEESPQRSTTPTASHPPSPSSTERQSPATPDASSSTTTQQAHISSADNNNTGSVPPETKLTIEHAINPTFPTSHRKRLRHVPLISLVPGLAYPGMPVPPSRFLEHDVREPDTQNTLTTRTLSPPQRAPTPQIASRTRYRGRRRVISVVPSTSSTASTASTEDTPGAPEGASNAAASRADVDVDVGTKLGEEERGKAKEHYAWNKPLGYLIPRGWRVVQTRSRGRLVVVPEDEEDGEGKGEVN